MNDVSRTAIRSFYDTFDGSVVKSCSFMVVLKTLKCLTFRTDTRHTQGSKTPVPALALILQTNENLFIQWTQWRWTDSLQKETNRPLFRWEPISKCFTKFKKAVNEL